MPLVYRRSTEELGVLGIDPGKQGGLVFIDKGLVNVTKMPATEKDIWECIAVCKNKVKMAYIEQVGGYIEGVSPGPAMFNFGWGYGGLRMALTAAGIPFETVLPRTWQKGLHIPPRKKKGRKYVETKTQWKNRLKAIAQRLFPKLHLTLDTSDALLIAVYGQRHLAGRL